MLNHYEKKLRAQKHLQQFNQHGDSRRDNKREHLKGVTEGQRLMIALAAIAMLMQRECIKNFPNFNH